MIADCQSGHSLTIGASEQCGNRMPQCLNGSMPQSIAHAQSLITRECPDWQSAIINGPASPRLRLAAPRPALKAIGVRFEVAPATWTRRRAPVSRRRPTCSAWRAAKAHAVAAPQRGGWSSAPTRLSPSTAPSSARPTARPRPRQMLERLAGRVARGAHRRGAGARRGLDRGRCATTRVWFAPMTSEDIQRYVATGRVARQGRRLWDSGPNLAVRSPGGGLVHECRRPAGRAGLGPADALS